MKPLPYPDNQHLEAAEGWLELGNHLEANEELEKITPQLRAHPYVLEIRYKIYDRAGRWEMALEVARGLMRILPENQWKVKTRQPFLARRMKVRDEVTEHTAIFL
jgi:tetratricopeptide (TPR) repeat protein